MTGFLSDAGDVHAEIGSHAGSWPLAAFRRRGLHWAVVRGASASVSTRPTACVGALMPEQRCQRGRHVDGFDVGAIGSGLKGQAVKSQRHVRVVSVRRGMIGAVARAERVRYREHPSRTSPLPANSCSGYFRPSGGVGNFALGELRLGVVVAQPGLLHGFADGLFGIVLRARERRRTHPDRARPGDSRASRMRPDGREKISRSSRC